MVRWQTLILIILGCHDSINLTTLQSLAVLLFKDVICFIFYVFDPESGEYVNTGLSITALGLIKVALILSCGFLFFI